MSSAALSETKRRLLATLLRGQGATLDETQAIPRRRPGLAVPISAEQRQVWLHAGMTDLPLYNEPVTIRRRGSFELAAFEASLNEIVARHEAWRTSFSERDGRVVQIVHPVLQVRLQSTDLRSLPAPDREREALGLATAIAREPFDLSDVPLFRARVFRLADDEHWICLVLHHLIFDGVSLYGILMPELAALYARHADGQPSHQTSVPLQYGDYAAWQDGRAALLDEASLDYWRRELGGVLPVLDLPTDRRRPAVTSYRGNMEVFSVRPEVAAGLKRLAAARSATLYMVLFAVFGVLMHRMSGQDDLLIGGVIDTRRRRELTGVMGYFLNSVVLRTRPKPESSFDAYLDCVRRTVLGALAAGDVPFERVLADLQPRRDPGRHPLFQVLFSVQPNTPAFPQGWNLTQMDVTVGTAKFDLYMELDDRPEGLVGRLLYNADLFDPETVIRINNRYLQLLEAVVSDPSCAIGDLEILNAEEARQVLFTWNNTAAPQKSMTLHHWLAELAQRNPGAPAATFGQVTWSYAELDSRAEKIAACLRAHGIGPGTVVGIHLSRSLDMLAALIGVLKAGGAFLPLDPDLPRARLQLVLDDATPDLVLTDPELEALQPPPGTPIVMLAEAVAASVPSSRPLGATPADDLAYVLYTSGSTGRPKGVEVSHRAVVNLLAAMQSAPGFAPSDSLLAVTTFSFDIAMLELFLPLVSGGRVVLATRDAAMDPYALAALIEQSGCTVMQATPSTWRALINAGWPGRADLRILCGGDVLPRALADVLLERAAAVWNMYGPTETTIWATIHRVEPKADPVPIGRPIANVTAYILDAKGRPLPIGVQGELYIGGAGLARGYRGQPALTRTRFARHDAAGGACLYRTGDRARFRGDGAIEWLGRLDAEVKVRGYRVALAEVEAELLRHPGVSAAAVRAWQDGSGETSLAAYVVPRGPMPDGSDLRSFLRLSLPEYMVPSHLQSISSLPMTDNGKLDRAALPQFVETEPVGESVPPQSAVEVGLAALWRELLGVAAGLKDDFFDLGGHSLLAAQLLQRIETVFGVRPPMARLFQASSLGAMAALVGGHIESRSAKNRPNPPVQSFRESDRDLMLGFESLGDSCEFGLVQRRHGAEPLSLLRFMDISTASLIEALQADFVGFDDPGHLQVSYDRSAGRGVVHQSLYDARYEFFPRTPLLDRERFRTEEANRLGLLARILMEDLEQAERIFVAKSRLPHDEALVESLFAAVARHGPATVLWVDLADARHPAGSVSRRGRHLQGWIDAWAPPEDVYAVSPLWLTICRSAERLRREG